MEKPNSAKNYLIDFVLFGAVAFFLINLSHTKENYKVLADSRARIMKFEKSGRGPASIAEVRAGLSADTVSWSATLPEPKSDL